MNKFKLFLVRFFGYTSFAIGTFGLIAGFFGGTLFIIVSLMSGFKNLDFNLLKNILYCIFFGAILIIVAVGILGKKKWGRITSIIFLGYSAIASCPHIIKYYKISKILTPAMRLNLLISLALFTFTLIMLYIFISPSIKYYFSNK